MTNREQIETILEGFKYIFEREEVDVVPYFGALLFTIDKFATNEPQLKATLKRYMGALDKGESGEMLKAFMLATLVHDSMGQPGKPLP